MDTAFVTTEHTELHGKKKNGGIKRVRKNAKIGDSNAENTEEKRRNIREEGAGRVHDRQP